MSDNVNHPKHYNASGINCECGRQIECIDITRHQNFNIGNAMKYLWRHKFKNGIEDLYKARWYIRDEIRNLEGMDSHTHSLVRLSMTSGKDFDFYEECGWISRVR